MKFSIIFSKEKMKSISRYIGKFFDRKNTYDDILNRAQKNFKENEFLEAAKYYEEAYEHLAELNRDGSKNYSIVSILQKCAYAYERLELNENLNSPYYSLEIAPEFSKSYEYHQILKTLAFYYDEIRDFEKAGDLYVKVSEFYSNKDRILEITFRNKALESYNNDKLCFEKARNLRKISNQSSSDEI